MPSAPLVTTTSSSSGIFVSTNVAKASATGGIIFDVPDTSISLYLEYNRNKPIPKLSMDKAVRDALVSLREQLRLSGDDIFPADDWTYIKQGWDCIIYVERTNLLGPSGKPQQLTYSLLIDTVEGLWVAMFSKALYCVAAFDVFDKDLGLVAYGSMMPWSDSGRPLNKSLPVEVI